MAERHREEVLNVVLATCLSQRGVNADPETILKRGRARPDVIATFRGLRCSIEGKIGRSVAQAESLVLNDARLRIEQAICQLAIAVIYPPALCSTEFAQLGRSMGAARLKFAVLTEAGAGPWHDGGINDILAELRRAHEILVRDDVLQQAVDTLNIGLSEVASALINNKGACDRLIGVLGVGSRSNAAHSV